MSSNIIVKSEIRRLVVKSEESNIIVKNADGKDGKSAFQQAVDGGYTGTEQEFNCSLSLLADVAEGKKQIADAINTKGGSASSDSSFAKLAEDIQNLNDSFITYGVTAEPKIDWLKYICQSDVANRANIKEIDREDIEVINVPYAFYNCAGLTKVNLPNITEINSNYCFYGCVLLNELYLPNIKVLIGTNFGNFKLVHLPQLEKGLYETFRGCIVESIIIPKFCSLESNAFRGIVSLKNIVLGKITHCGTSVFGLESGTTLRNVTIGQDTNINLLFTYWTATNVISEGPSSIDELNSNLRTNLLEKLADHSTDGQTRTLRLGWLAHVTQENIDYANSKGWTLTT